MPSDSSTLKDSDDIDLGWDDEPSSPSATVRAPTPEALRVRAREPAPSIAPRLSPPPKPTARQRYSLTPVSVAPRPGSSSPRSEPAADLHVEIEVLEPTIPELSRPRREFRAAPPLASLTTDIALEASAPASFVPSNTVEVSSPAPVPSSPAPVPSSPAPVPSSPAPVPSEWPEAGVDSLGPSQLDALTPSSIPEFRGHSPRRALVALGITAGAGLIWLVAGAIRSAPDTRAELSHAHPMAAAPITPVAPPAPPAPPAIAPTAVTSTPGAEAPGTATSKTPDTIPVAVHISPPDAFVFESGRRLGRGDVTVDVAPGTKITLVAQRRGYRARIVVLDGTYTSVNIALRRATASRGATASSRSEPGASAAAPSGEPSESDPKSDIADPGDAMSAPSGASNSAPTAPPASADATQSSPVGDIAPL